MKNDRLKLIILILSIVAAIVLIVMIFAIANIPTSQKDEKKIYRQVVGVDKSDKSDFKFITCYKNDFVISKNADGSAKMDCYVGNSTENSYNNMYFELYVVDGSKQELLYKSGNIPKGKCVDSVEITGVDIAAGEYDGKLVHYILDDNGKCMKVVSVVAGITIE